MADTSGSIDWEQVARRVLKVILVFGAVVASFIFLTDLARQNGWPWYAALLLPMCIDALGGVALLEYRAGNTRGAGWVAAGAITASFVGNGLSHLYAADVITPTFVSIAVIGGVPALSLGLAVHLNKRKDTDESADSGGSHPAPPTRDGVDIDAPGEAANSDRRVVAANGAGRPPARRRPTKTKKAGTGGRGPNGPAVDVAAADIRRLGLTSQQQAMDTLGIGTGKVRNPLIQQALADSRNGGQ